MDGWIKLHRKFASWEWFNISEMVHLFIYLLLNANSEDGEWRGIKVKRGQIITGLNSLNEKTKISIQTLRTCLMRLEKTGEINTQITNKYRIITICNYELYQDRQQATNKQSNKQLTSNQQTTNNKQEEKEEKNIIYDAFYDSEIEKAGDFPLYIDFVKFLFGDNDLKKPLTKLLSLSDQVTFDQFKKLYDLSIEKGVRIKDTCYSMQNYTKKSYSSFYLTLNNWIKKGNNNVR